jgi:hypothetical protein
MLKQKYFSTGYIYIYSICLALLDTLTLSRDNDVFLDFELLSMRILGVFTYWLIVKNFAGIAERNGYSYKLAMVLGILGLPIIAGVLSLLPLNIFLAI